MVDNDKIMIKNDDNKRIVLHQLPDAYTRGRIGTNIQNIDMYSYTIRSIAEESNWSTYLCIFMLCMLVPMHFRVSVYRTCSRAINYFIIIKYA